MKPEELANTLANLVTDVENSTDPYAAYEIAEFTLDNLDPILSALRRVEKLEAALDGLILAGDKTVFVDARHDLAFSEATKTARQAAKDRVERFMGGKDYYLSNLRADLKLIAEHDARALLAGPPEPSVEEVARAIDPGFRYDDSVLNSRPTLEIARRVQALFRSKTDD